MLLCRAPHDGEWPYTAAASGRGQQSTTVLREYGMKSLKTPCLILGHAAWPTCCCCHCSWHRRSVVGAAEPCCLAECRAVWGERCAGLYGVSV
jgi:hypothetical protein